MVPLFESGGNQMNRSREAFATTVAVVTLLIGILVLLAGFGTRWDWWTFRTGFSILRWSVYAAIALTVFAVAALVANRAAAGRSRWLAVFALVVGLVIIGNALIWRNRGRSAPPIHDISTDTDQPPEFVAVAPLRADAPNPAAYGGAEIAAQQRTAYPDIQPVELDLAPDETFLRALRVARDLGWEIVAEEREEGRIEATDETFWFGFKDDIVIRITPEGAGSRVDVRSVSRVGRGDVGTNARRIREFSERLRAG
jgi:uncharacterized protein (DUF1499 family)